MNFHLYQYAGNNPVKYTDPDGKEDVYFLYVYKENNIKDQRMQKYERSSIDDDIKFLQEQGLTVKVVEHASKADVKAAFADPEAMLIVTSGHGYDAAGIQTADGGSFIPSDLTDSNYNLRTVIFENCFQGEHKEEWAQALGEHTNIVGWEGTTSIFETKRFNNSGILDRQDRNLRSYLNNAVIQKRTYVEQPG
jgi:hypothetical protein